MGIETQINKSVANVFRRAYIKRRDGITAKYEANWFEITEYVKSWGSLQSAVDNVRLNKFTHSGISLKVSNNQGKFNPEYNVTSLWYGYLTRYRSLIKVEAGYVDENLVEYPTNPVQGIFIMTDEIPLSGRTNDTQLRGKSLMSVFDEVRVADIPNMGLTQTASQLIEKIRDHTDGAGNTIFRQFISATNWLIETTTINYNLATSTSIGSMTCFDLLTKLAECEGNVLLINRTGQFEFRSRDAKQTTSVYTIYGLGHRDMALKELVEYRDSFNKYYNYFRLKYLEDDTSTSFVFAGTTTVIDPSNPSWKYGQRVYELNNTFFPNTTSAQAIVNNLFSEFSTVKEELRIETKMIPHIDILDRVTINHESARKEFESLWDYENWDDANWSYESGENFDFVNVDFKILSRDFNLDNFTTTFNLRRI